MVSTSTFNEVLSVSNTSLKPVMREKVLKPVPDERVPSIAQNSSSTLGMEEMVLEQGPIEQAPGLARNTSFTMEMKEKTLEQTLREQGHGLTYDLPIEQVVVTQSL